MAIAYDATSQNSSASASNITFNHTTSGTNRYLYVTVFAGSGTPTVTYNGVSMTQLLGPTGGSVFAFGLANPALGTNTVSVSAGASILTGCAVSYTGVDSASPINTSNSASQNTTAANIALTSTVDNCWMVVGGTTPSTSATAGANTTLRTNPGIAGGLPVAQYMMDSGSPKTPAGALTLNLNTSSSSNTTLMAVMLTPNTTAPVSARIGLLGVGQA